MHNTIAPILGWKRMLVFTGSCQFLAIKVEAISRADGLLDLGFFVGMDNDGDTDILCVTPTDIRHMAGIGGCTQCWGSHRVL